MTGARLGREAGPPRGLLRGRQAAGPGEHRRIRPGEELAPLVAHFWWVRWALPSPVTVETLPHPAVHVVFEGEKAEVAGVCTTRFTRRLEKEGAVFGIKFRPAVCRQLLGGPVSRLRDRVEPVEAVWGREGLALRRAVAAASDMAAKMQVAESFLRARIRPLAPDVARLRDLVERVAVDRSLLRVGDLAGVLGLDLRTLQRRFAEHVGIGPKWVIQRHRLLDAAEWLGKPRSRSLAAVAAELGYADQAHFARDFKRMVGASPARFAAREGPRTTRRR